MCVDVKPVVVVFIGRLLPGLVLHSGSSAVTHGGRGGLWHAQISHVWRWAAQTVQTWHDHPAGDLCTEALGLTSENPDVDHCLCCDILIYITVLSYVSLSVPHYMMTDDWYHFWFWHQICTSATGLVNTICAQLSFLFITVQKVTKIPVTQVLNFNWASDYSLQ